MEWLVPVSTQKDIAPAVRETAVGDLLRYHNLDMPHESYATARLLIGMCMDHRERLRIPENFAYILRAAGANLRYSEFQISYAVAIGEVSAIALIAHTQCGMVNLMHRREQFIEGLVERGGWEREWAESHFMNSVSMFEIGNELNFLLAETMRLRLRYPTIPVVPLMYRVEDNNLYHVKENRDDALPATKSSYDRSRLLNDRPSSPVPIPRSSVSMARPLGHRPGSGTGLGEPS